MMENQNMKFLNIMLSYLFSSEVILQGMVNNDSTNKQINAEIYTTLKDTPA